MGLPDVVIPIWLVFLLDALLLVVCAEAGYRFGLRLHRSGDVARKEQISAVEGAILGLLGLLLAFTFSMAVGRFDDRRRLVVEEANAVGTTYLRASLLPLSHQGPVRVALRAYLDVRITARLKGDRSVIDDALRRSAAIQDELWRHAIAASREQPGEETALFIESLNETIDADAKRVAAGKAEIPVDVWILLTLVAGCGTLVTGYGAGAGGVRSALATWLLPLLVTVVIILIFDIAHGMQGMIDISQQALVDLRRSMTQ